MNRQYSESLTIEQKKELWQKLHPDNRVNARGRDNNGEAIEYSSMSNDEEIKEKIQAIFDMIKKQ